VKGKHKQAFAAHEGPIKKVCWIRTDEQAAVFASASQDQTVMIWEWDLENNNASCKWICKGHERSVEALRIHPESLKMASGSWDGVIKVWSASPEEDKLDAKLSEPEGAVGGAPPKPRTRVPVMSLAGHRESVSAIGWMGPQELISASWDHTLKIWDLEAGGIKSDLSGNKAFFDMSWSPLNQTVITASADRHIRLYDPRSSEGSIVKGTFTSHSGWVSSVNWSTTEENLFISGSHDNLMKFWDRRSPRAPLYNLTGHTENILCTNWSNPKYLISGGSDNTLRIFSARGET
jgi:ribosome biogenesis protein YTM1